VEKMQDGDTGTSITIPLAAFHLAFGMIAMDQRDGHPDASKENDSSEGVKLLS
jgi:hypothetical protein